MTMHHLVHCDALHDERTPPECRAFIAVPATPRYWDMNNAAEYVAGKGWTFHYPGRARCPSCSHKEPS